MNKELLQLVDAPQFPLQHRVRRNTVRNDKLPCLLLYREYEAGHELNEPMRNDFKRWLQQEPG